MGDNAREIFIANLKKLMKENKMNQTDIANAVGISRTAVSEWIHGRAYPRVDAMQRLADIFGITISTLTGESGSDDSEREIDALREKLKSDPQYRILFKTAADVSSEDIMQAVRILKALKGDQ